LRTLTSLSSALIVGGSVFAVSLGVLGCLRTAANGASQHYAKIDDLQPYVEPYSRAYILTGSPVETKVVTEKAPGEVSFKFFALSQSTDEEPLDDESYTYGEDAFCYAGNMGEQYEPDLPLLKFPLKVGDSWDWKGTHVLGGVERKATAKVTTSHDMLNTVAGEFSTVRSVVELAIETGTKDKSKYKLTFWFAPKKGVVRREFEFSTTREPVPPKEATDGP
jgi:hypothetical protein